jgi:hypothetical protein
MKTLICTALLFTALLAAEDSLPQVIDFSKLKICGDSQIHDPVGSWERTVTDAIFKAGFGGFNSAPEIGALLNHLRDRYQITSVFETGTYMAATTQYFSLHFDEVHTVDNIEYYFNNANKVFADNPNVHRYMGSSEVVLNRILPSLTDKRMLFYLDAHWYGVWPLLDEIAAIAKTHKDNCIIVVDDFKVPGRPDIYHDAYNNHECSYDYIKQALEKAFSAGYTMHYLIPYTIGHRAKFVAIPKEWKK